MSQIKYLQSDYQNRIALLKVWSKNEWRIGRALVCQQTTNTIFEVDNQPLDELNAICSL